MYLYAVVLYTTYTYRDKLKFYKQKTNVAILKL